MFNTLKYEIIMKIKKYNIVGMFILLAPVPVLLVSLDWAQKGEPIISAQTYWLTIMVIGASINFFKNFIYKSPNIPRKNIPTYFAIYELVILILFLSVIPLGVFIFNSVYPTNIKFDWDKLTSSEFTFSVLQLVGWVFIGSLLFFFNFIQISFEREEKLQNESANYKYKTLKSHLDPHFLFNSLNTLSELVYEDANKADNFIQKLSGTYRYIIDNEEIELIVLKEELEFVERYFELQKVRCEEKIQLTINASNLYVRVLPVTIQSLVENAIKHNSFSLQNPLIIEIKQEGEYLIVKNNIQKKNVLKETTKTGLQNLKEMVKLKLNKELIISETDNEFIVKIPFVY